eukprot:m.63737 g.63737  ORF g.63737 m.63737 type:complete len:122 (+) comp49669_c0_seq2:628-993(+)
MLQQHFCEHEQYLAQIGSCTKAALRESASLSFTEVSGQSNPIPLGESEVLPDIQLEAYEPPMEMLLEAAERENQAFQAVPKAAQDDAGLTGFGGSLGHEQERQSIPIPVIDLSGLDFELPD